MKKILLGESERDLSNAIKRYLVLKSHDVLIANDGVQVLNEFLEDDYEFVILDEDLSRINIDEIIQKIKKTKDQTKILLLSNRSVIERTKREEMCDKVLLSPFTVEEFNNALKEVGVFE